MQLTKTNGNKLTTKSEQEKQFKRNNYSRNNSNKHKPTFTQLVSPFIWFLFMLIFGIMALEAYFNFAGVGNEEFLEPDRTLGVRHIANKKVVWRLEGYSDEKLNTNGLRDTEHLIYKDDKQRDPLSSLKTYRIALLGDSATEGLQVSLDSTYGKQLEKLLNKQGGINNRPVEIINFGCSSYSNGQEMILFDQKVKAYKPDLVVLMYNRGDYLENIRDPSTLKAEPRPYFHIQTENKQSILVQDNTIMDFNREIFDYNSTKNKFLSFLRQNSRIYGVLSHTNLALSMNEPLYFKSKGTLAKFIAPLFGSKVPATHVEPAYIIQDPWLVTATIIDKIHNSTKNIGAKFLLLCFPNNINEQEYARQISLLAAQAKSNNFDYLDLTPAFLNSKNPKSLFLKYHFSAEGHKLTAQSLFDKLK